MNDPLPARQCAFCDDWFVPNTAKQLYDTADCRARAARQKAYDAKRAEREAREAAAVAQ